MLSSSMAHLVRLIEELLGRQVGFRSLGDGIIDTTTASGELVFNLVSPQGEVRVDLRAGALPPCSCHRRRRPRSASMKLTRSYNFRTHAASPVIWGGASRIRNPIM